MCNDENMSETQPETPEPPEPSEPEPTPTWMRDFRRVLVVMVFGVLFFTFIVWAATEGLIREKGTLDTPLAGDPLWAGICAGAVVFMFPLLFFEHERSDDGFRRDGLVPLIILSVLCGAVITTAVMMTWPSVLGDEAIAGTVSGDLGGDPTSVLLVLFFIIGGMSWCMNVWMPMIIGGFKVALWLILPYLGIAFFFLLMGPKIFENPASWSAIITWAAVALSGLAVLTVLAALRNVIDKPISEMTEAERAETHRVCVEERRRRGLTNESPLPGIDTPQQSAPANSRPGPSQRPPQPPASQPPRPAHPPRR